MLFLPMGKKPDRRAVYAFAMILALATALAAMGCRDSHHHAREAPIDLSKGLYFFGGDAAMGKDGTLYSGGKKVADEDWTRVPPRLHMTPGMCGSSFWVRVRTPQIAFANPVLYFPVGSYLEDFELFLGNKLLKPFSDSSVFNVRTMPVETRIIPLPGNPSDSYLYLHFKCDMPSARHAVIGDSFYLAPEKTLLKMIVRDEIDRLVLGFIFMFSGLMSMLVFIRLLIRDRIKDVALLGFVIMSICVGLFTAASSNIATVFFVPPFVANNVVLVTLIIFPVGLFLFIDRTLGPGWLKLIRRSWQIFAVLAVGAVIGLFFRTQAPMAIILILRSVLFLAGAAAAFVECVRAIINGRTGARIIGIGLLIFAFYAISDMLMKIKVVEYRTLHFHWGFFILMMLLGYLIYLSFERGKDRLRQYSEELEEKSSILQDLNRTLEERVQERTEELREKNRELDSTNRVLAQRNWTIENEVAMARRIQQQLIPASPPYGFVSSLYRPMDQVGGDFYDFIEQGETGLAGIFISDVSGHGIPAALITSMVKTIILQAGERRADPAALFAYMNELLYGKTVDNFITAFYGIIDIRTGTITYCNAGHNSPLMVSGSSVGPLGGGRSLPLATMDNETLWRAGKSYSNQTARIPVPGKLVLFTDGLTEATGTSDAGVQFEDSAMPATLEKLKAASCHDLVSGLYGSLVEFRGNEKFEDDVCILCVDLEN